MGTEDVFDGIADAGRTILDAVASEQLSLSFPERSSFSLTRIDKSESIGLYEIEVVVATARHLRVPLRGEFRHGNDLADTVYVLFDFAREAGVPLRMVALVACPVRLGAEKPEIDFQLTSWMLGPGGKDETFIMRVRDADDFRAQFADEIGRVWAARVG